MPALRAIFAVGFFVFGGCSSDTPPVDTVSDEITAASTPESLGTGAEELACRAGDAGQALSATGIERQYSASDARIEARPFRCLRLLGLADVSGSDNRLHVVDISSAESESPGQLRMALHEIKTKGFLRDRAVGIVSDGKRFAALEKECADIKASGVADVIALVPEETQVAGDRDDERTATRGMTPPEFIAERAYGVWHIVNLTAEEDLKSPLLADSGRRDWSRNVNTKGQSRVGLVRTLLVYDGDESPTGRWRAGRGEDLPSFPGQVFVLEGGLAGLKRYETEAMAMARALARPRVNERGCAG